MRRERLPSSALSLWAGLNGIQFKGVAIEEGPHGRGYGVFAREDIISSSETPLITVPKDLVLSVEAVQAEARYNKCLRELLEAAPELATVRISVA